MRSSILALLLVFAAVPSAAQPMAPYFIDVSGDAGLTGIVPYRVSVGDLNGDGYPDILMHTEPNHAAGDVLDKQFLLLNEPGDNPGDPFSRKFVDHTAGSGIRDNRAGTSTGRHSDAAIFADVDNDGDLDIFTSVYLHRSYALDLGRNDLLINDGSGNFSLSPVSTFHTEPNWNTPTATFLDYDNDGSIDLYIGTWYNPDSTLNIDHLYQGHGDGSFTNVTAGSGLDAMTTCVYAVATFDWDGDGDMDLFAPPYSRTVFDSYARHWRNNGDGTFTRVESSTNYDDYRGFPLQKVSFGTMPRDYDNDGDMDFLEIMTHGDASVYSATATNNAGVFSWDFNRISGRSLEDPDTTHHGDHFASWIDVDNDMLVDFFLTESGYDNPRLYLFRQQSDNTFDADTPASGLDGINTAGLSPGYVTPLDFDLDGDEDLLVTLGGELRLYRNDVGTDNHWLAIDLEGVGAPGYANRSAIGARVTVVSGGVSQMQEVHAGNGHEGPMRPLRLHFGLGANTSADSITVRWPNVSLTEQVLTNVTADQFLTISEPCAGAADPTQLRLDRDGADVVLTWDDPADGSIAWNVYRDAGKDPSGWGAPHAGGVSDEDAGTAGIQHRDSGAAGDVTSYYYLITATNICGETALR